MIPKIDPVLQKTNPRVFLEAIERGVLVKKRGDTWVQYNGRLCRMLTTKESPVAFVINAFNHCLLLLEQIPVSVKAGGGKAVQPIDFQPWIEAAKETVTALKTHPANNRKTPPVDFLEEAINRKIYKLDPIYGGLFPAPEKLEKQKRCNSVTHAYQYLRRQLCALLYRLDKDNDGLGKDYHDELYIKLKAKAENWKAKQEYLTDRSLMEKDLSALLHVAHYPEFVEFLLDTPEELDEFFKLVIRDTWYEIDPIVKFPGLVTTLKACLLSSWIGFRGNCLLKVQEVAGQIIPTLPFEFDDNVLTTVNMLDFKKKVSFDFNGKERWELSIKDVLSYHAKKNEDVGPFIFFNGFKLWHNHKLGKAMLVDPKKDEWKYNLIDLDSPNFWEQIPHYEISLNEAKERYGEDCLKLTDDGQRKWMLAVRITIQNMKNKRDAAGTHGFNEYAIPSPNGFYIFNGGTFAEKFPSAWYEFLFIFANTVVATEEWPDSNIGYNFRLHDMRSWALHPNHGRSLMEIKREDLKTVREGKMDFQFGGGACALKAQKVVERLQAKENIQPPLLDAKEKLLKTKMLKVKTEALVISHLYRLILALPRAIQNHVLGLLMLFFWPWRTQVPGRPSLMRSESYMRNPKETYVPWKLWSRHKKGKIPIQGRVPDHLK